jgi:futalosine hydrolase
MNLLIVSATIQELDPFLELMTIKGKKINFFDYELYGHTISTLVTGVGALNTSYALGRINTSKPIHGVINIGIAGSYTSNMQLGNVVSVAKDRFADIGAYDHDGRFLDAFEDLKLMPSNQFPYVDGWIYSHKNEKLPHNLLQTKSITVNTASGYAPSIEAIKLRFSPDIETMEGAGFFYACAIQDLPCLQLRAISNYVEPRDKSRWDIDLAISNLTKTLDNLLEQW